MYSDHFHGLSPLPEVPPHPHPHPRAAAFRSGGSNGPTLPSGPGLRWEQRLPSQGACPESSSRATWFSGRRSGSAGDRDPPEEPGCQARGGAAPPPHPAQIRKRHPGAAWVALCCAGSLRPQPPATPPTEHVLATARPAGPWARPPWASSPAQSRGRPSREGLR